jgi:hypothetical protein
MAEMADILNNVSWMMQRRVVTEDAPARHKPWYDDVEIIDDDCATRSLTPDEWQTMVNPSGPWELHYDFDARGLPDIEDADGALLPGMGVEWTRAGTFGGIIDFGADATVRDVLGAIAALPVRYGFLEGFCRCTEGARTWFVLQYGT